MVNDSLDRRVDKLEFGYEGILTTLHAVKSELEKLNSSSSQIHQMTALLDGLSEKITTETAQLQSSLRDHITRTDSYWRQLEDKHNTLNLVFNTQKASVDGQIRGARALSGLIGALCAMIVSLGTWMVNRELEAMSSQVRIAQQLQTKVHELEIKLIQGGQK